jgi:hypothetical protein
MRIHSSSCGSEIAISTVVASEATQSSARKARKQKRGDIRGGLRLDCVVASLLAMTET